MNKLVVTNLRIQKHDWLRLKTIAAESNMSVNGYVNWLIDISVSKAPLGYPKMPQKSIYDLLPRILKKRAKSKKFELSEDDQVIYDL